MLDALVANLRYPFDLASQMKDHGLVHFYEELLDEADKSTAEVLTDVRLAEYAGSFMVYADIVQNIAPEPLRKRPRAEYLAGLLFMFVKACDIIIERERAEDLQDLENLINGILFAKRNDAKVPESHALTLLAAKLEGITSEPIFQEYWQELSDAWKKECTAVTLKEYIRNKREIGAACGKLVYACIDANPKVGHSLERVSSRIGGAANIADSFFDWSEDRRAGVIGFPISPLDRFRLAPVILRELYGIASESKNVPMLAGLCARYIHHELKVRLVYSEPGRIWHDELCENIRQRGNEGVLLTING